MPEKQDLNEISFKMLGELITRILILFLGYAYPAFECFKAVEKNRIEVAELRFWCQYWILVAFLTVFERVGDTFISWLPMYDELKLALIIYLWYPKTKGSSYVYETLFRPFVTNHETDIETRLKDLSARAWDFAIYYWQNCTELGQTKLFDFFASKSGKTRPIKDHQKYAPSAPPLPVTPVFNRSVIGYEDYEDEAVPPSSPSNGKSKFKLLRRTKPRN